MNNVLASPYGLGRVARYHPAGPAPESPAQADNQDDPETGRTADPHGAALDGHAAASRVMDSTRSIRRPIQRITLTAIELPIAE